MAKVKYTEWLEPDGLLKIEAWARDGLIEEQIAKNMGINRNTLRVWKNKHASIDRALKKGKEVVDIEVENALLKRAMGYTYTETKTEETDSYTKVTKIKKHMAPDVTAQIYWLKNRKPEQWREKKIATETKEDKVKTYMTRLDEVLDGSE